MKKFRGFFMKHRVISLFRGLGRRYGSPGGGYRRIRESKSRILRWKEIWSKSRGYLGLGEEGVETPKGKMAVYVGEEEGEYERVLVPLIYINHPLFLQLLRKAEEEYGHHHPRGITIPCRLSDFQNVSTTIAAASASRKMLPWKRPL